MKASVDPHRATHLLFATCETRRVTAAAVVVTVERRLLLSRRRRSRCLLDSS
jgi:hypothetical protein